MDKKIKKTITAERLREVVNYNQLTGVFTWTKNTYWKHHVGLEAGTTKPNGYRYLQIDRAGFLAHRMAWLYVFGKMPQHCIDHINGNKADNRIANLRDVTPLKNSQNRFKANADNKLGVLGVRLTKNGYRSQIRHQGKVRFLGHFKNVETAYLAYLTAKRKFHEGNML